MFAPILFTRLLSAVSLSLCAVGGSIVAEAVLLFPRELIRELTPGDHAVHRFSLFDDDRAALALVKSCSRGRPQDGFRVAVKKYDLRAGGSRIALRERAGSAWRGLAPTRNGQALVCAEDGSLYRLDLKGVDI